MPTPAGQAVDPLPRGRTLLARDENLPVGRRQSDPESYRLHLIVSGDGTLAQGGREAVFGAGQFILVDSSHPYRAWRSAKDDRSEAVVVQFHRASLGLAGHSSKSQGAFMLAVRSRR
ncbi:hypothetical protein ACIBF6_34455 [Streptosporangium amethystogenes]|uniref:AraC-like ligand-binding domain-containing protein n=1 Tax=Streptosporangium amethystogenes TaxID=2002 RepID=UPI003791D49B